MKFKIWIDGFIFFSYMLSNEDFATLYALTLRSEVTVDKIISVKQILNQKSLIVVRFLVHLTFIDDDLKDLYLLLISCKINEIRKTN